MLHEKVYSNRGEMEQYIKECQLDLFVNHTSGASLTVSERVRVRLDLFVNHTSGASMRANRPQLWFASVAYVPLRAQMRVSARRMRFVMPHAEP